MAISERRSAIEIDKEIVKALIETDTYSILPEQERKKYHRRYETNMQLKELQIYKLLRSIVADMNALLKGKPEKMRIFDEGDGLFLEFK